MIYRPRDMREETRENMRGGDGTVHIRHLVEKDAFAANVRLCATLRLPPGASIGRHQHQGEDEVYIVTRGQGMLDDGETETRVETGDAILTGKGASHAVRNDGDTDLELIAFIACYGE
jgi:mannose-6-phosphate isomerase-like protein (cupin superfamily)